MYFQGFASLIVALHGFGKGLEDHGIAGMEFPDHIQCGNGSPGSIGGVGGHSHDLKHQGIVHTHRQRTFAHRHGGDRVDEDHDHCHRCHEKGNQQTAEFGKNIFLFVPGDLIFADTFKELRYFRIGFDHRQQDIDRTGIIAVGS